MNNDIPPLPDDVLEALQHGQPIEAIKRLRAATGLGLKEAKDAIDGYQQGNFVTAVRAGFSNTLPASVLEAIRQGNKIEAIKRLREETGLGLKEAKDAVEAHGITIAGYRPTIEKPKTGSMILWLSVFALLGFAVYYFLQSV